MADKKINQLDPAAALSANDLFPVVQNPATGEALKATIGALRTFVLGGANAGARLFFNVGPPSALQGVNGDVAFDIQAHAVYQKQGDTWALQDTYGVNGGSDRIRFTAVYGSAGLSADGKTYVNAALVNTVPTQILVDATPLVAVAEFGDTPAFDEWNFDPITGTVAFGAPVPAGFRITIIFSF